MAVPPQPPSAVTAQPPELAVPQQPSASPKAKAAAQRLAELAGMNDATCERIVAAAAASSQQQPPAGPLPAVAATAAPAQQPPAAPLPAAANEQQFVPHWTSDDSGQWIWTVKGPGLCRRRDCDCRAGADAVIVVQHVRCHGLNFASS